MEVGLGRDDLAAGELVLDHQLPRLRLVGDPVAVREAVRVGRATQHPPEALHDRIRIASVEPLLELVNLGVVPADRFLLGGQSLRVGVLGCLKAPQSLPLGRGTLGEHLRIPSLGSRHRPLIPPGAPEEPADRTWLGRCECLPLPCRKRLGVLTGVERGQLHRAPELRESSPRLSG